MDVNITPLYAFLLPHFTSEWDLICTRNGCFSVFSRCLSLPLRQLQVHCHLATGKCIVVARKNGIICMEIRTFLSNVYGAVLNALELYIITIWIHTHTHTPIETMLQSSEKDHNIFIFFRLKRVCVSLSPSAAQFSRKIFCISISPTQLFQQQMPLCMQFCWPDCVRASALCLEYNYFVIIFGLSLLLPVTIQTT